MEGARCKMSSVQDFLSFVKSAPTAFHASSAAAKALEAAGFSQVYEERPFSPNPGGKYYFLRGGSAVIAFVLPENGFWHFQIVASHADSPTFKLKGFEEAESCSLLRLPAEGYGGMIRHSWLDRPLSVAGRIIIRTDSGLSSRLVNLDRDLVLIPSLPIHMNREVNKGTELNPQVDLYPVTGEASSRNRFRSTVAESAECEPDDLIAGDLFLYNRTPGSIWGVDNAFFSCPRIDDLECVFASLVAFLNADVPANHVNLFAMFDNEEVGSGSQQGADSDFLSSVLQRICSACDTPKEPAIASSFMVSADNAHAAHPAHPEKYDEQYRCRMNGGVVIKHSAPLRYTTNAESDAVFSEILRQAGVPVQHFWNRSDLPGGSTLGHIAVTHTSMRTIDVGLAQLAMHSSYETAGVHDLDSMIKALEAFYQTEIQFNGTGSVGFKAKQNPSR